MALMILALLMYECPWLNEQYIYCQRHEEQMWNSRWESDGDQLRSLPNAFVRFCTASTIPFLQV